MKISESRGFHSPIPIRTRSRTREKSNPEHYDEKDSTHWNNVELEQHVYFHSGLSDRLGIPSLGRGTGRRPGFLIRRARVSLRLIRNLEEAMLSVD